MIISVWYWNLRNDIPQSYTHSWNQTTYFFFINHDVSYCMIVWPAWLSILSIFSCLIWIWIISLSISKPIFWFKFIFIWMTQYRFRKSRDWSFNTCRSPDIWQRRNEHPLLARCGYIFCLLSKCLLIVCHVNVCTKPMYITKCLVKELPKRDLTWITQPSCS